MLKGYLPCRNKATSAGFRVGTREPIFPTPSPPPFSFEYFFPYNGTDIKLFSSNIKYILHKNYMLQVNLKPSQLTECKVTMILETCISISSNLHLDFMACACKFIFVEYDMLNNLQNFIVTNKKPTGCYCSQLVIYIMLNCFFINVFTF